MTKSEQNFQCPNPNTKNNDYWALRHSDFHSTFDIRISSFMTILGIDPGTATTGYGVIKISRQPQQSTHVVEAIDHGCILTKAGLPVGDRLKTINNELGKLITKYQPGIMAVESLYFFKNLKTAMPVSQAKGVILLTAAKKRVPVVEYTPLEVKMAVVGYGKAEKKQVQKMVQTLLKLEEMPKVDDAADALGIALCHAFKRYRVRLT